ncbi:hypothetical protein ACRZOS_000163 [Enterobacter kobei]
MDVSFQEIEKYRDFYGVGTLQDMNTLEYQQALEKETLFFTDSHDFLRSSFCGEILATNRVQIDAIIEYLKNCRDSLPIENI